MSISSSIAKCAAAKFPRGCKPTWRWIFACCVVCGIALRLLVAVRHHQLIHPDEHFQTLEIAHRVVTGIGWKSWEWYHGTRSWFVPALYAPVIALLRAIGCETPSTLISACRVFTAFGVISATWLLLRVAARLGRVREQEPIADLPLASSSPSSADHAALGIVVASVWLLPDWIRYSPATFSDTWGFIAVCGTLAYLFATPMRGTNLSRMVFGGALLGGAFWIRIQLLAWALPLLVLWVWRASRRAKLAAWSGFGAIIALHGVLDRLTWGHFFHSTIANIRFNIFQGVAASNGVEPVSYYFAMLLRDNLWLAAGAAAALALPRVWREAHWRMIALPGVVFFAAHLGIAHKEERFLLPMWPVLALLSLAWWQHLAALWREQMVPRWLPRIAAAALLLLIGVSTQRAWRGNESPYGPGLTLTERAAALRWEVPGKDPPCLLLVDQFWVWTRGEMGVGRHLEIRENRAHTVRPEDFAQCAAALVGESAIAPFANIAQTHGWRMCARDARHNALWCAPRVKE